MDRTKRLQDLLDGEPRISSPGRGVLLSPAHPERIGFVTQRAIPTVNEQGAVEACAPVVACLNEAGACYGPARAWNRDVDGLEEGVDCLTDPPRQPQLLFQVTRALRDPEVWRHLGMHKGVMVYSTIDDLAWDLWDAVEAKAVKIPPAQRDALTLVLDAQDLFAHHAEPVPTRFRQTYGTKAAALGFHSIWVSGGYRMFVHRLA